MEIGVNIYMYSRMNASEILGVRHLVNRATFYINIIQINAKFSETIISLSRYKRNFSPGN